MKLIDLEELQKFPIRINNYDKENGNLKFILGIEVVFDYIDSLPVIEYKQTDEPDTAYWEDTDEHNVKYCSNCKETSRMSFDFHENVYPYKFCPNCGRKMSIEHCTVTLNMKEDSE